MIAVVAPVTSHVQSPISVLSMIPGGILAVRDLPTDVAKMLELVNAPVAALYSARTVPPDVLKFTVAVGSLDTSGEKLIGPKLQVKLISSVRGIFSSLSAHTPPVITVSSKPGGEICRLMYGGTILSVKLSDNKLYASIAVN